MRLPFIDNDLLYRGVLLVRIDWILKVLSRDCEDEAKEILFSRFMHVAFIYAIIYVMN